MPVLLVTNPKAGGIDYVGSTRRYSIASGAKKMEVTIPEGEVDKWMTQFQKDGLIVEKAKSVAPTPAPAPTTTESKKESADTKDTSSSKNSTSSKK